MKRYFTKPKVIKSSYFKDKRFSMSPSDHREIIINNKNVFNLGQLKDCAFLGNDYPKYYFNTNYKFITINNLGNEIEPQETDKFSTKEFSNNLSDNVLLFSTRGSLEDVSLFVFNGKDNKKYFISNNIYAINITKDIFYVMGFCKSKLFKDYANSVTTGGTVKMFNPDDIEKFPVPFPTNKNNKEPHKVKDFVSLIVQNIIDKEKEMRIKNDIINSKIETELKDSQKTLNYEYKYPKISEIKRVGRLDTGMYEKKYKHAEWIIHNSNYEKFSINENELKGGNTPKTRIFEPTQKEYMWFTPTDIKRGVLNDKHYIKALSYNLGEKMALLFSNRSNCGECILYNPNTYKKGGHHNQGIYRKEFDEKDFIKNIFILCLFNSNFYQDMISHIATGATFGELRIEQYANIDLPQFTEQMQLEISNEYYSKQPKNMNLNFDNYLELEKERNKKLGIFQLNMELFSLKEKLEDIIDKIIMEEPIEINFDY